MKKFEGLYIVIDFDGTCVTHAYPRIGKDIGALTVLRALLDAGHRLILFTMRSGEQLAGAVKWFKDNRISLYGIQTNPDQASWTTSPKAYGQLIIDDAALGCPLITDKTYSDRPYVDWDKIRIHLESEGVIPVSRDTVEDMLGAFYSINNKVTGVSVVPLFPTKDDVLALLSDRDKAGSQLRYEWSAGIANSIRALCEEGYITSDGSMWSIDNNVVIPYAYFNLFKQYFKNSVIRKEWFNSYDVCRTILKYY